MIFAIVTGCVTSKPMPRQSPGVSSADAEVAINGIATNGSTRAPIAKRRAPGRRGRRLFQIIPAPRVGEGSEGGWKRITLSRLTSFADHPHKGGGNMKDARVAAPKITLPRSHGAD